MHCLHQVLISSSLFFKQTGNLEVAANKMHAATLKVSEFFSKKRLMFFFYLHLNAQAETCT